MIDKKEFSLFDPKPEEDYLNQMAKNGYQLTKVDEQGYHFDDVNPQDAYYLVEYYEDVNEALDLSLYENQGFELISNFITQKGVWLYLKGTDIKEPIQRHMVDRDKLLDKAIKRIEMFGLTLSGIIVIFSIFSLIQNNSIYFWLLLIIGILAFGYVLSVNLKLRKLRK